MNLAELSEMVDKALYEGIIEAECKECGMTIQCEADATSAWCDSCEKSVKVTNPLINWGLI